MVFFEVGYRHTVRSLSCLLVSSTFLGLILSTSLETPPKKYDHPKIGDPYIVDVKNDQARFDISLDNESDLFLVVSSLGQFDREYSIECTMQRIEESEIGPFTPLIPLEVQSSSNLDERLTLSNLLEDRSRANCDSNSISRRDQPCGSLGDTSISEREFFLHVTEGDLSDPNQYVCVKAINVREGKYVRVYLDAQENRCNIASNLIDEIVRIFDDEIVPRSKSLYGQCRDIDADEKFTILLSPWLSRLRGGKVSIGGFVRSSDFQKQASPPFGNRCDMMYLNSTLTPRAHLKALLAHEYAHAVAFGIRSRFDSQSGPLPVEEDWLNEAIAHLSENYHNACWSNIDHRVDAFLKNTAAYPLVVPDYYQAGMWRDRGCRGATFLFLRWCVDRFGWQIVPRLMKSSTRGIDNISSCTGLTFTELYRRWSVSLLQPSVDRTRSIDINSRLGKYDLHGPNLTDWNIAKQDRHQIVLKGTTTTYLRIPSACSRGSFRFTLEAQSGTKLQLTVLKRTRRSE